MKTLFVYSVVSILFALVCSSKQPNIVVFLVDDMGYNDVGFRGSNEVQTPNIDALAYNGVVLNRFYTLPTCTPSRTALMTGNYPIRSGMQGTPITAGEERHIPWDMPTLPERLKELNYSTHLVGKWHLGQGYRNATPTRRGFDSHYGYWNGYIGYFNHRVGPPGFDGLDMHDGFIPDFATIGEYATDLFTMRAVEIINRHSYKNPLFLLVSHLAPHTGRYDTTTNSTVLEEKNTEDMNRYFSYIKDINRRRYVDIVKGVDDSLGTIMEALSERDVLQDTIVLFLSDNGGQTTGLHENFASNWPLRGLKFTVFEGGVRGTAVFYSKNLRWKGQVNDNLMHITDLLPTFYKAGGGDPRNLGRIDGINQLRTILYHIPTKRNELLINIDEVENYVGMLAGAGRYKFVKGTIYDGIYDGFYGDSGRQSNLAYNISAVLESPTNVVLTCAASEPLTMDEVIRKRSMLRTQNCRNTNWSNLTCNPCLFDLQKDPCETRNIARVRPVMTGILASRVGKFWRELVPQQNKAVDPNSNPSFYGDVWQTWLDTAPVS